MPITATSSSCFGSPVCDYGHLTSYLLRSFVVLFARHRRSRRREVYDILRLRRTANFNGEPKDVLGAAAGSLRRFGQRIRVARRAPSAIAAVYGQRDGRDEPRAVRGKKEQRFCDILGASHHAHRRPPSDPALVDLAFSDQLFGQRLTNISGRHRVDPDAMRPPLAAEHARQHDQSPPSPHCTPSAPANRGRRRSSSG